jgi:hypothetical protein
MEIIIFNENLFYVELSYLLNLKREYRNLYLFINSCILETNRFVIFSEKNSFQRKKSKLKKLLTCNISIRNLYSKTKGVYLNTFSLLDHKREKYHSYFTKD